MDQQSRRDLFRFTGAAGCSLVAGPALAVGSASAQPAAAVQQQPNPASIAGDRTTADIIIETLVAWGVPVIFGMVGDRDRPPDRGDQRAPGQDPLYRRAARRGRFLHGLFFRVS